MRQCTKCGKKSSDIKKDFGYRMDRGRLREQPWCRRCRIRYSRCPLPKSREALTELYVATYPEDKAKRSVKFMEGKLLGKIRRKEMKVI